VADANAGTVGCAERADAVRMARSPYLGRRITEAVSTTQVSAHLLTPNLG
jgi:hypothetical protein